MDPGHAPSALDAVARAQVGVGDGGEALLVRPQQLRDVAHGDGEDDPAGADAERQGEGGAQEDVAVPRHDAARHRRHQHVHEARHQLLAALARRRQRGDGRGEGPLEAEGLVYGRVDAVFGRYGLLVEEEAGSADVHGETVRGRRTPVVDLVLLV